MRSVVLAVRTRPVLSASVPPCTATVASLSRAFTISGGASSSFQVSSTISRAALRSGYATAAAGSGPLDHSNGRPDPFANRPPPIANRRATPQEKVETYIRDDFHLKPLEVVTNERLDLKPFVLHSHRRATSVVDSLALLVVKSAGSVARRFFGKRYGHGAVVMETVAAVPPMVAAVCLHLSSLRTGHHQTLADIRIHALLEESETQRAHLLAFCRILRPTRLERLMILVSQGVCFSLYFLAYLVSPRFCHRLLGYMKEEDITAYSQYLELINKGLVDNVPAPMFAIDRWKLMPAARLSDFIAAVQADEAQHRDANHALADEFARSTLAQAAASTTASAPSSPIPAAST